MVLTLRDAHPESIACDNAGGQLQTTKCGGRAPHN
jgi:hypothetical protein